MSSAIEDYALIGDCETAALVGRDGSMDWLCLPRFDSSACFAALLASPENGRWLIAPKGKARTSRRYRPNTLILETQFETSEGAVTLIDFMPLRMSHPKVIRIVRGDRGSVQMQMDLVIRFDYGLTVPWVTHGRNGHLVAIAGPDRLIFRSSVPVHGHDLRTVSEFTVRAHDTAYFELQYSRSFRRAPSDTDPKSLLKETEEWWRKWTSECEYDGPCGEMLKRSLITLKALTYAPSGGIVAAPTTSLPEQPGGQRNWDYRYCWIRDATFTLLGFIHAGYYEEARRWRNWLVRAVAGSADQIQIMYGPTGERLLREWEVPWLSGYGHASPVRVGNAASEQLQLDVFGELADALHQASRSTHRDGADFDLQTGLLEHLRKIWRNPDRGIWEVRDKERQFTYSKVMAWVAFDRTIKTAEKFGLKAPLDSWRKVRQQIHDDVCRFGFNPQLGSFVQSYGSQDLDASLLLIPIVGFLPASDPRIVGTVRQIEKKLMHGGFVLRYRLGKIDRHLGKHEGAFLPCTFWLADYYCLAGRFGDAERLLKRLLKIPNDVGLLSEEYSIGKKEFLGNFPQALSHVALVNTIINVHTRGGPARQRASAGPSSQSSRGVSSRARKAKATGREKSARKK